MGDKELLIATRKADSLQNEDSVDSNNSDVRLLDEIISQVGFGKYQFLTFLLSSLVISVQGLYFSFTATLFIPLQKYYQISESKISIISAFMYAGGMVTNFLLGYLSEKLGRRFLNLITFSLTVLFHVLFASVSNSVSMGISFVIIGAAVSFNSILVSNILVEVLPNKARGFILCSALSFFHIGTFYILLIYYFYMPEYNQTKFSNMQWLLIILPIGVVALNYLYLQNSPREYILENRYEEAFSYLNRMRGATLTIDQKQTIINEIKNRSDNKEFSIRSVKCLFERNIMTLTTLMSFIWLFMNMVNFGPQIIVAKTLSSLKLPDGANRSESEIIQDQIIVNSYSFIAHFFAGGLSEIPMLGRKYAGTLGNAIAFVFSLLIVFSPSNYPVFIGIYSFANSFVSAIIMSYTAEVFPTTLRDYASGYLNALSYIGAMLSQPLYVVMSDASILLPYYVTAVICFIMVILFLFLPFETCNNPLDRNFNKKEAK